MSLSSRRFSQSDRMDKTNDDSPRAEQKYTKEEIDKFEKQIFSFWNRLNQDTPIHNSSLRKAAQNKFRELLRALGNQQCAQALVIKINNLIKDETYSAGEVEDLINDIKNGRKKLTAVLAQEEYDEDVAIFISTLDQQIVKPKSTPQPLPELFNAMPTAMLAANYDVHPAKIIEAEYKANYKAKLNSIEEKLKKIKPNNHKESIEEVEEQLNSMQIQPVDLINLYRMICHVSLEQGDFLRLLEYAKKYVDLYDFSFDLSPKDKQVADLCRKIGGMNIVELFALHIHKHHYSQWIVISKYINRFINHSPENLGILLLHINPASWINLINFYIEDVDQIIKNSLDINKLLSKLVLTSEFIPYIKRLLIVLQNKINKDEFQFDLLYEALREKNYQLAAFLVLTCRFSPDALDVNGKSYLYNAVFEDDFASVKWLLKTGKANPNTHNRIISGDEKSVMTILGPTPLCAAATNGNIEVAKLLVKAGANPNPKGYSVGHTPYDLAKMAGNIRVASILMPSPTGVLSDHSITRSPIQTKHPDTQAKQIVPRRN